MKIDMPKLESPFEREMVNGQYVCVPKFRKEYSWIFTPDCLATEKFDGTNVSILIENGKIARIFNRTNEIDTWSKNGKKFFDGISEALNRGYFKLNGDGQIFGELIGEGIQSNDYRIVGHLWLPLEYLKEKYVYKFWNENNWSLFSTEEVLFMEVSNIFKRLWSLYKRKLLNTSLVDENTLFYGTPAAEGIVFHNKITGEMCKLRRDMFDWWKGRRH